TVVEHLEHDNAAGTRQPGAPYPHQPSEPEVEINADVAVAGVDICRDTVVCHHMTCHSHADGSVVTRAVECLCHCRFHLLCEHAQAQSLPCDRKGRIIPSLFTVEHRRLGEYVL